MTTQAPAQNHYPGLDALRGIAILLVVLYHYFSFFRIGWLGVDLFFVLSGYLITSGLLKTRNQPGYVPSFFAKRILRIFPLYFLVLTAFYASSSFLFAQKQPGSAFAYYTDHQLWFWGFAENWLFIKKSVPPVPYLQHFWSLAVEEQFYLLWPFLIYSVRSLQRLKILLAALFLGAMLLRIFFWLYPQGHEAFYYNSFARMDSLAAGGFLALLHLQNKKLLGWHLLAFGAAFLLIAFVAFFTQGLDHNSAAFATVGYSLAALFFMACCQHFVRTTAAWARSGFLCLIGKISYGIYVYHIPIYLVTAYLLAKTPMIERLNAAPFVSLVLTFCISWLSYRFFESPFLQWKKKFSVSKKRVVQSG